MMEGTSAEVSFDVTNTSTGGLPIDVTVDGDVNTGLIGPWNVKSVPGYNNDPDAPLQVGEKRRFYRQIDIDIGAPPSITMQPIISGKSTVLASPFAISIPPGVIQITYNSLPS
jgi:hypothetical protein